jgi:methylthioribose-1-phosphate isomerase
MEAVRYKNRKLRYLDQRFLPGKEVWRRCLSLGHGYKAIKELRVRGAPLIGIFACYTLCIAQDHFSSNSQNFFHDLDKAARYLKSARPTAVNLAWAVDRIREKARSYEQHPVKKIKEIIIKESEQIHAEDNLLCRKIAENGISLIKKDAQILTHCNTGFLATGGDGTALGIMYKAVRDGKNINVYIDETRPLLQGARLTAWECMKKKVPCMLVTDNTAASLMQKKLIDIIIVGADRIAANGDTANKIGTYNLAVCAHYHRIPFYVAAPSSTFDLSITEGTAIPVEQRNPDEVRKPGGLYQAAPAHVPVCNPAFDVTPGNLITAIITDKGILQPPYGESIADMFLPDR